MSKLLNFLVLMGFLKDDISIVSVKKACCALFFLLQGSLSIFAIFGVSIETEAEPFEMQNYLQ